jgi:hypothetical protein
VGNEVTQCMIWQTLAEMKWEGRDRDVPTVVSCQQCLFLQSMKATWTYKACQPKKLCAWFIVLCGFLPHTSSQEPGGGECELHGSQVQEHCGPQGGLKVPAR